MAEPGAPIAGAVVGIQSLAVGHPRNVAVKANEATLC